MAEDGEELVKLCIRDELAFESKLSANNSMSTAHSCWSLCWSLHRPFWMSERYDVYISSNISLLCVCVSVCVCVCLQEVLGRGQILPYRSKRSMFAPSMSVTENQRPPFPRVIGQVTQTYTCALICVVVIGARRKSSAFCFALLSELALDSSCLFEQNVLSQRNKIAFLIVWLPAV